MNGLATVRMMTPKEIAGLLKVLQKFGVTDYSDGIVQLKLRPAQSIPLARSGEPLRTPPVAQVLRELENPVPLPPATTVQEMFERAADDVLPGRQQRVRMR